MIPILLRYVLECCETTAEAVRTLCRIPVQMVSNVMVLDKTGDYAVVYLSPDRHAVVRKTPLTTNRQLALEWPEGDRRSETAERAECLAEIRSDSPHLAVFVDAFHRTPLYRTDYNGGLGTLDTSVIRPCEGAVEYRWPGRPAWIQSIRNFTEGKRELPV
jgi:predicted choloylglycine hydrolase